MGDPLEQPPTEIEQLRAIDDDYASRLSALAREGVERFGVRVGVAVPDSAAPIPGYNAPAVQPAHVSSRAVLNAKPDEDEARREKIKSHIRRAITFAGGMLAMRGLDSPQWFGWLFDNAGTIATLIGFAMPLITAWWSTRNINTTKTHEAQRVVAAQYLPAPSAGEPPATAVEVGAITQAVVAKAEARLEGGSQ